MRILFRADASIDIGTGHVMRCLTLANALRVQGTECTFVCRSHQGHLGDRIQAAGHALHLLPAIAENDRPDAANNLYANWLGCTQALDAQQTKAALDGQYDWLVVDHYGLDREWESALRAHAGRILAIDDLANRAHDCDLLLDQNLGRTQEDYDGLAPAKATRLIGPRYALLRPEFAEWREYSLARRRRACISTLLISLGGIDRDNVTAQALRLLVDASLPRQARVIVIMGSHAPHALSIRAQASSAPLQCEVLVGVDDMARIMANCDLCIGAAGSSIWERCALGLPSIVVTTAENQRLAARALKRSGLAIVIDQADLGSMLSQTVIKLMGHHELALGLSNRSAAQIDGYGASHMVEALENTL